jgi:toxin FitB
MIVLDTDVLSELMLTMPDPAVVVWLDRQPRTSIWSTAITVMEIRHGLGIVAPGRRQGLLTKAFEVLVNEKLERRVLTFDHAAAEETALLMTSRQRAGRPREIRDSMIAGIAVAHRATLATRNIRHFADLTIPVVDPSQG